MRLRSAAGYNPGLAVVALAGAIAVIGRDTPRERNPLDMLGAALVTLGLFSLR